MNQASLQFRSERSRTRLSGLVGFFRYKRLGAIGLVLLVVVVLLAVMAPVIAPHDPNATDPEYRYAQPSKHYVLGGDKYGRDVLSRILWGARISLGVGAAATLIGSTVGTALGMVSGYAGGLVDLSVQRLVDTLLAFPALILALVIVVLFEPSFVTVTTAIAITTIGVQARVMRSATLGVKALLFIEGAQAIGCGATRVVLRHVLPNTLAPFLILVSAQLGAAIIAESSLSFLGLGMPPTAPSWGTMLSAAREAFYLAPWLAVSPGVAIFITVFGLNVFGDALRDVLDPRRSYQ